MRNVSPAATLALLIAGIVAVLYAWQFRQPPTTADFTLFYRSAQQPPSRMYERPPGPPRSNMNPPHFQLLLRPLTWFSLETATAIFRTLSLLSVCGCTWWIAKTSSDRWNLADIGALLAWTPMAAMLSLNQVAWILWPLLVCTWWCWRKDRWTAGAIACGLAISFKPFLGVLLLWLIVTRRLRAAFVTAGTALAAFATAILLYGFSVFQQWIVSLRDVQWWWVGMNASLEGWLARLLTRPGEQTVTLPPAVAPLALIGGTAIIVVTLARTRRATVDDSWAALISAGLLASPLGWVYYAWWLLGSERPTKLLIRAPMLWLPIGTVAFEQTHRLVAATLGSAYFWGIVAVWLSAIVHIEAARPFEGRVRRDESPALHS